MAVRLNLDGKHAAAAPGAGNLVREGRVPCRITTDGHINAHQRVSLGASARLHQSPATGAACA